MTQEKDLLGLMLAAYHRPSLANTKAMLARATHISDSLAAAYPERGYTMLSNALRYSGKCVASAEMAAQRGDETTFANAQAAMAGPFMGAWPRLENVMGEMRGAA